LSAISFVYSFPVIKLHWTNFLLRVEQICSLSASGASAYSYTVNMRFHRLILSLILCVSPLVVLGQQVVAPEPQTGGIIGTVTDVNDDPVEAATVVIDGPASADRRTTATNDNGFFVFNSLRPAVTYHVTVSANGFGDWTSPAIVLNAGQQLDLKDVKLKLLVVETTVAAVLPEQLALQQVKVEETQRVLSVFPNFYTVYDSNAVALTPKLKFRLAFKASFDVVTIAATAFYAGLNQAADTPAYQQGAKGYGQRFGAAYADGLTDIMIGGAILPSLLHQDPRYFYQGTGTKKSRALHAISTPFVCKGDNGRWQFNTSSIAGDLASGALSNLYYPDSDRGAGLVFSSALIATGGRMANALAQEFILRKFTSNANKKN
jgi:hypothetical protein